MDHLEVGGTTKLLALDVGEHCVDKVLKDLGVSGVDPLRGGNLFFQQHIPVLLLLNFFLFFALLARGFGLTHERLRESLHDIVETVGLLQ